MLDIRFFIDEMLKDNLMNFAFPVFLVLIILEYLFARNSKPGLYSSKDSKASFWMLLFTAIVEFIPKLMAFVIFFYLHELSPLKDIIERQWWAWLCLFLFDDFTYYWFHRSNHEVRLFWAGHVPHHSAIKMNLTVALRQGVGERIHKFIFWLWLPLLGFDALMIFTVMSINLIYQFGVHTESIKKFPKFIEYIFNTPSHHRVHHASNIRYLDCNHAGALIVWDRIFGTFSEEINTEKPIYGLTKNITSWNPFHVAGHEYVAIWKDVNRASKFSDKLKYIFYAPGWSHDGKDLRAKTLRKNLNRMT